MTSRIPGTQAAFPDDKWIIEMALTSDHGVCVHPYDAHSAARTSLVHNNLKMLQCGLIMVIAKSRMRKMSTCQAKV